TQLRIGDRDTERDVRVSAQLSPDARLPIVDAVVTDVPAEWDIYEERSLKQAIDSARTTPLDSKARNLHQWWIANIERGTTRPLWGAPSLAVGSAVAWSPDSRSIVIAPTALPPNDAGGFGRSARSAAVVDVQTGNYQLLPIELFALRIP